jgi:hypothetical protein
MKPAWKSTLTFLLMNLFVSTVLASPTPPSLTWIANLRTVAYALGWLMMVLMGLKWIISESANERAEAKKGMIYIVVGLLIVTSARALLQLYCTTVGRSGIVITCNLNQYGL